jgi:hypothetical protein
MVAFSIRPSRFGDERTKARWCLIEVINRVKRETDGKVVAHIELARRAGKFSRTFEFRSRPWLCENAHY